MLQMQISTSNMGWNDYQDWNLPRSTHYLDSLAWFLNGDAASGQPQFFTDAQSLTADAANGLYQRNSEKASGLNFCGLQSWYSTGIEEFLSISPVPTARPQLSGSEFSSYASTSLNEENQPTDQLYSSQPWSPKISRLLSSVNDGAFTRLPSSCPTVDLSQELDNAPSHSSEDEDARGNAAGVNARKKLKIAHNVIEKNYRSRINDGMAELRHCVPSTARVRSCLDSKRPGSQQGADDAAPNYSSGKVATLSDAVQYVKSLELENEGLHGLLDLMQRRNNTLQKIALSKADTNLPAMSINLEEIEEEVEEEEADREGSKKEQASWTSKKIPLDRARSDKSNSRRVARSGVEPQ